LNTVDTLDIAKNTVFVFASDNGGFANAANMGPLNGSKGTTMEGGIRVPLIIRWPGHIAKNTESTQVCVTFDLTRSFLQLANARFEKLDGYDIVSHVTDGKQDFARTLFWRGRRGERTWRAVRDGERKYVSKTTGTETEEWLFDLATDIGETKDLIEKRPNDAKKLKKLLADWEDDVRSGE
jgi:N-acetylgalactosamine-6-sulfatase